MLTSRTATTSRRDEKVAARGIVARFHRALIRNVLTALYQRYLEQQVLKGRMPGHVGIILDGNRRHARALNITDPDAIYNLGADKLQDVLEWCAALGIKTVTLWVLSTDNFKRSPEEMSSILAAIERRMRQLAEEPEIHRRKVKVRASGRLDVLPASVVEAINAAIEATQDYDAMCINIAVAYGGREEIIDAIRKLLIEKEGQGKTLPTIARELTPADIARHLYSADLPEPDLIIRTSGEVRLSGFLLWQSVYSEFYFSDVYWPAFRKIDFLRAVRSFQQRTRRFGK
jgi:short-chain Z-isoprenyl diphosphate synthase